MTFKKDLFAEFAQVGKSLGNGNRLELLEFLAQGERSVDELSKASKLTVANTSQHLQGLRRSGLVKKRTEGQRSYYRLSDYSVVALLALMRNIAENNLAEIQILISSYLKTKDQLEPISRDELLKRVNSGEVTVIDVRPEVEYESGHLPRAINIPMVNIESELDKLPQDKEVVAYCRGPYCLLAFEAIELLRSQGFNARRLEDGFPEWKLRGLPVEQ
ncbi:MAG: metalloregulator ArsR/SmtB family transcription factor [Gammaproteobacteria bacterium]|nr:metalloregulator ArsR/SmtB family transcription factor [Gammaproteobacteria bacterium]